MGSCGGVGSRHRARLSVATPLACACEATAKRRCDFESATTTRGVTRFGVEVVAAHVCSPQMCATIFARIRSTEMRRCGRSADDSATEFAATSAIDEHASSTSEQRPVACNAIMRHTGGRVPLRLLTSRRRRDLSLSHPLTAHTDTAQPEDAVPYPCSSSYGCDVDSSVGSSRDALISIHPAWSRVREERDDAFRSHTPISTWRDRCART